MSRPFVRVYHEDLMRDYASVYDDDAALAAWLRLLVVADKMWPSRADVPRSVKHRTLSKLTTAGLVVVDPSGKYRIRGYESERQGRQEHARKASRDRWSNPPSNAPSIPPSNADAHAQTMPTRARTSTSTEYQSSYKKNGEKRARGLEPVRDLLPEFR